MPTTLGVNIDHVATLRQARRGHEPDVLAAAAIAEAAGADQITVHLREDRRHIQDADVRALRKAIRTRLNFEMGLAEDIQALALELKPHMVTLVPERRQEITTEGGLDVAGEIERVAAFAAKCRAAGIVVSTFIDPEPSQADASKRAGADAVEFHTGPYAHAFHAAATGVPGGAVKLESELARMERAADRTHRIGLAVYAGHGLTVDNLRPLLDRVPLIAEVNIGHHIISRAVFVGLDQAVRDIKALCG